MLVRNGVVGVVRTRAGIAEAPENLAGQQPARSHAVRAVLVPCDNLENGLEVVMRGRRALAVRSPDRGLRRNIDVLDIERRQERFHLVVTERPEELRGD